MNYWVIIQLPDRKKNKNANKNEKNCSCFHFTGYDIAFEDTGWSMDVWDATSITSMDVVKVGLEI